MDDKDEDFLEGEQWSADQIAAIKIIAANQQRPGADEIGRLAKIIGEASVWPTEQDRIMAALRDIARRG